MKKKRLQLIAMVLLVAIVLTAIPAATYAHGPACFNGSTFLKEYRNGSWHWFAHVPKTINAPLAAWHVHGPRGAMLWPDSVQTYYVKVYFSWPANVSPWLFYSPSQFQACLN